LNIGVIFEQATPKWFFHILATIINALYLTKFQYLPHPNLVSMFAFLSPINNKNWKTLSKGKFICHMWSIVLAPIDQNWLYIYFCIFKPTLFKCKFMRATHLTQYYGTYFILAYMPLNCWH